MIKISLWHFVLQDLQSALLTTPCPSRRLCKYSVYLHLLEVLYLSCRNERIISGIQIQLGTCRRCSAPSLPNLQFNPNFRATYSDPLISSHLPEFLKGFEDHKTGIWISSNEGTKSGMAIALRNKILLANQKILNYCIANQEAIRGPFCFQG